VSTSDYVSSIRSEVSEQLIRDDTAETHYPNTSLKGLTVTTKNSSLCLGRDSNKTFSPYKTEALPLVPACPVVQLGTLTEN
jgi:hypothetical protein